MSADAFYDPTRGFAGGPGLISFDPIEESRRRVAALPKGITRNIRAAEVGTGVDLTRASIAEPSVTQKICGDPRVDLARTHAARRL